MLTAIARQSGLFKSIEVKYDRFIEPLQQVVHQATVIDLEDRLYTLPGVATIAEKMATTENEMDEHDLAGSRALRKTLKAAGVDPLERTSVVSLGDFKPATPPEPAAAEALSRHADLQRIHILATEKGLISFRPDGTRDLTEYRHKLAEWYRGETSAAGFDALERASLIEAIGQLPDADEFAELDSAAGKERKAS